MSMLGPGPTCEIRCAAGLPSPAAHGGEGVGEGSAPASSSQQPRSDAGEIDVGSGAATARSAARLAQIFAWPLLALLWTYRRFVSPAMPAACRFHPSCSRYASEAIATHGPIRGTWLAVRRLLRCHPWNVGGPDPVPPPRARAAGTALSHRASR